MTISGALMSALSSLNVEQQQINVISNNVANASTPGYVERSLPRQEQLTGNVGSGVTAQPIERMGNQMLEDAANQAAASNSYSTAIVGGLKSYITAVGQPTDSTSLPSTLSAFSAALSTLSATPDNAVAQNSAIAAAQNLTGSLHNLTGAISTARENADTAISTSVATVNATLSQLAQNEATLTTAQARGESTAPMEDTRATLIATLSQQLPVHVFPQTNGGIIVTTDNGTTLWDGNVHTLSFTPTGSIAADAAGSTLGQVTVGGQPLNISSNGIIAGNLALRDTILPDFADQLDQIAGNLISGFETAGGDAAGHGIFQGTPSTAGTTDGLATNITVNPAADPTQGGNAAAISYGVHNVTATGLAAGVQPGDNSTILNFVNALNGQTQSYTGNTTVSWPASMTLANAASQAAGLQQSTLSTWTARDTARTTAAQAAQTALGNGEGVNVDQELQRLLLVQQTYSASSNVIQAAAKMLDQLNTMVTNA
jgi:flagellar hook-associated protein 1 FlgK